MRRKLRTLSGLDLADWRQLIRACGFLFAVSLGLRALGFARVRVVLQRGTLPARPVAECDLPAVARALYLLDLAARVQPIATSCLVRSLVLQRLLTRRGLGTDLRIGVARHKGRLRAHAWLESDGRQIGLARRERQLFTPLVPFQRSS